MSARARFLVATILSASMVGSSAAADSDGEGEEKKGVPPPPAKNLEFSAEALGKDGATLEKALVDYKRFRKARTDKSLRGAIRTLREIAKTSLAYPIAGYYLAELYSADEEFDKAREAVKSVLEVKPEFFEAQGLMGWIEYYDKRPHEALAWYEKSLAVYPHHHASLLGLAYSNVYLGKFGEAEKAFARALEVKDSERVQKYFDLVRKHIQGPGWAEIFTAETDTYVVKSSLSKEYSDHIARCMERVRKLYKEFFPTIDRVPRKYEVRVHRSLEEYLANEGPPNTLGYYFPATRTLHLFEQKSHADTLATLYHEGFHQYLHEYIEQIPTWFNEGLAECFSGAIISPDGKQAELVPDPGRLGYIRAVIQDRACPTAAELMTMSHEEMYGQNIGIHYAQAWAIIFYCLQGGNSGHRNVLGNYFRALRKGLDQQEAFEQTFGKVDMKRLETNWRNYVDRLPDPKEIRARLVKAAEYQQ